MSQGLPGANREFNCRHCGMPNDRDAPECRMCLRPDWRPPDVRMSDSTRGRGSLTRFQGCLLVVAIAWFAIVGLAFRAGRLVDLATGVAVVLLFLIFAVAIALFSLCTAV